MIELLETKVQRYCAICVSVSACSHSTLLVRWTMRACGDFSVGFEPNYFSLICLDAVKNGTGSYFCC